MGLGRIYDHVSIIAIYIQARWPSEPTRLVCMMLYETERVTASGRDRDMISIGMRYK